MDRVLPNDSKSIAWLRFPLAAMVVYLHSMNVEFTPVDILMEWETASFEVAFYDSMRVLISRVLGHLVVPSFMFISGYLFFIQLDKWNWNIYLRKIRQRIHTLLIPYLLWIIIPVFINIVWLHKPSLIGDYVSSILEKGLWHILTDPLNAVLWFLRDLIVLVVISPFIYFVLKKIKWQIFILLFIFGMIVDSSFVGSFFWFSLGGFFCLSNLSIIQFAEKVRTVVLWGFVIFGLLKLVLYNDNVAEGVLANLNLIISQSSVLCGVFLIFYISTTHACKKIEFPICISSGSFLIYVLHMEVLWRSRWLMNIVAGDLKENYTYQFFVYLIAPLLTVIILIILNSLLRKYSPKINYILTASR